MNLKQVLRIKVVDYSPHILAALEDMDVLGVYPMTKAMTLQTLELFAEALVLRLHTKMLAVMQLEGEKYVEADDAEGLTKLFIMNGINIQKDELLTICETIVNYARHTIRFITPIHGGRGSLWYCKLYVDINQEEESPHSIIDIVTQKNNE